MARLKQVLRSEEVGGRVGTRTYQEMIKSAVGSELTAKSLSEKEVRVLVDSLAGEDRTAIDIQHSKRESV